MSRNHPALIRLGLAAAARDVRRQAAEHHRPMPAKPNLSGALYQAAYDDNERQMREAIARAFASRSTRFDPE